MKIRKKTKHFRKKAKPIPVETYDLPNNVRIGYKDVKIRYVRPNYKKWEMTDCFGEYKYNMIYAVKKWPTQYFMRSCTQPFKCLV
jgi:hypothetical protein